MARPKKEDSSGKRIIVSARILETSYNELKAAADISGIPIATLVALIVDDYLAKIRADGNTLASLIDPS